jgi:hypothetical protein
MCKENKEIVVSVWTVAVCELADDSQVSDTNTPNLAVRKRIDNCVILKLNAA